VCSLADNALPEAGMRCILEAIVSNEDCALVRLAGIQLRDWLDVLGVSLEFIHKSNDEILSYVRERRLISGVKSARGGTR
jgi:hypothetical protein